MRELLISLRVAKEWGKIREAERGPRAGGGAQQRGLRRGRGCRVNNAEATGQAMVRGVQGGGR